jgi:hypothetical protein
MSLIPRTIKLESLPSARFFKLAYLIEQLCNVLDTNAGKQPSWAATDV